MIKEFNIRYLPRIVVKGQVLADEVAEFTEGMEKDVIMEGGMLDKQILFISTSRPQLWELYVDGAANRKGSGIRIILVSPKCITMEKSLRLSFPAMNNKAEYEALRVGLNTV